MTVGIAGLGLIGGSFAKAIKEKTEHRVLCIDVNSKVTEKAISSGAADGTLDKHSIGECNVLIVALYPNKCIEFLTEYAPYINKNCIVFDCAGTKTSVCECGFGLSDKYGFCFIGAHPMAGTERSGFEASFAGLFNNAYFIMVSKENESKIKLKFIEEFALSLGFGKINITTAELHDQIIAYTSQLAHVVSSAFIKSPTSLLQAGFSAGSFKDLTRVAYLNEEMWSQLFLENKEYLIKEIDILTEHLLQYKNAIESGNKDALRLLLKEGKERKLLSEREGI